MALTRRLREALLFTTSCGLACAACASADDGDGGAMSPGASINPMGSTSATVVGAASSTPGATSSSGAGDLASAGSDVDDVGPGDAAGSMTADAMAVNTAPSASMAAGAAASGAIDEPAASEGGDGSSVDEPAAADEASPGGPGAVDQALPEGPGAGDETSQDSPEGSDMEGPDEDPAGGTSGAGPDDEVFDGKELFILIGQSNMSGMSPMPSEPWPINERVTFMVQFDCERLGQTAGEWLPAEPPLHGCQWATGGIGLGLADFFGAKMAEQWPEAEIGLVPNAVPGQLISIYLKEGATQAPVAPYANAYEMTVERSRKAQEQGRIRAILLHQGESDDNQMMSEQWLDRVATVVADLRADLNLGEAVPLLAGQIGPSQWQKHNAYVDQIPDYVPNAAVISAEGTAIHDIAHFDEASAKIMGERYAERFLEMVAGP